MHNVQYDFSSCHIDVPLSLSEDIIQWGQLNISDDDIFVTQKDPTFGREDEIHITILYGIHDENSEEVKSILEHSGPVKIQLGKTNVFSNPFKFDVVMIEAYSEGLARLNEKLKTQLTYTNRYMQYNPHVTISYVKKGKGWKHAGLNFWEGKEFMCDYAIFSSKNGTKNRIGLV